MTTETQFLMQDLALYAAMFIFAVGTFIAFCAAMQAKWGVK